MYKKKAAGYPKQKKQTQGKKQTAAKKKVKK